MKRKQHNDEERQGWVLDGAINPECKTCHGEGAIL